METSCRCGHPNVSTSPHPCHKYKHKPGGRMNELVRCGKPAEQRFYNAHPVALAGVQMKLEVTESWACEECWVEFKVMMQEANEKAATKGAA